MNPQPQDAAARPSLEPVVGSAQPVAPDLIGLSVGEACTRAAWAGASVNATRVIRPRGPWGVVVAQSPPPGTRLREQWRIHVLVSTPPPAATRPDDD